MNNHETRHPILRFNCPFCRAGVDVTELELVDGGSVTCSHCREEATLIRERIEHEVHDQWLLIESPQIEEDRRQSGS